MFFGLRRFVGCSLKLVKITRKSQDLQDLLETYWLLKLESSRLPTVRARCCDILGKFVTKNVAEEF